MGPNSGGNIEPSQWRNTKNCNENSDLKNLKSILENLKSILESSESTIEDLWKKLKEIADNEDKKSFFKDNNIWIEFDKNETVHMKSITVFDKRKGISCPDLKIISFNSGIYNITDAYWEIIGYRLEPQNKLRKDIKEKLVLITTLIKKCTDTDDQIALELMKALNLNN